MLSRAYVYRPPPGLPSRGGAATKLACQMTFLTKIRLERGLAVVDGLEFLNQLIDIALRHRCCIGELCDTKNSGE